MIEDLKALPYDHAARNSPLAVIGAEYRFEGTKTWFDVKPSFGIAKNTFNQLGPAWTNKHEWRAA